MEEAKRTGAKIIAVACPYCKIMLNSEAGEDIKVLDISEILDGASSNND
jgi:Fe-S oxidoreductase